MKKYRLLLICIFLMMTGCSSTGNISSDNVYASQQQYLADMAKELRGFFLFVIHEEGGLTRGKTLHEAE